MLLFHLEARTATGRGSRSLLIPLAHVIVSLVQMVEPCLLERDDEDSKCCVSLAWTISASTTSALMWWILLTCSARSTICWKRPPQMGHRCSSGFEQVVVMPPSPWDDDDEWIPLLLLLPCLPPGPTASTWGKITSQGLTEVQRRFMLSNFQWFLNYAKKKAQNNMDKACMVR